MPCMPPMLFDERPAAAVSPSISYADSSRHQRELCVALLSEAAVVPAVEVFPDQQ